MNKRTLTWLWLLFSSSLLAKSYQMELPTQFQNQTVTDITVAFSGSRISGINKQSLLSVLDKKLNQETKDKLHSLNDVIPLNTLHQLGFSTHYNPSTLTLSLSAQPELLSIAELSYSAEEHSVVLSKKAPWSVLSSINYQYLHTSEDKTSQLVDVNTAINVGANTGVSFITSHHLFDDDKQQQFYRGDTYFSYANHHIPLKAQLGDISSAADGHMYSGQFAGLHLSPAYRQLQPQKNIAPISKQYFYLPQAAEVDILVNGFLLTKTRLNAGRYNLSELPMIAGENNVEIVATYGSGEQHRFTFNEFFNPNLLKAGHNDYDLAIGVPSSINQNEYRYGTTAVINGFYKYGVNQQFTTGINGSYSGKGHILGFSALSQFDKFGLHARVSHGQDQFGVQGYALSLNSEHFVWGKQPSSGPNLRFSYDKRHKFNASHWQPFSQSLTEQRLGINYTMQISAKVDANISLNRHINAEQASYDSGQVNVNWRLGEFRLTANYKYNQLPTALDADSQRFSINISWNSFNPNYDLQSRIDYRQRQQKWVGRFNTLNRNHVNTTGYDLSIDHQPERQHIEAGISHNMTGLRVSSAIIHNQNDVSDSQTFKTNLSSSVAIVNGRFGVGNNIQTPFAIVHKHPSLNSANVAINPSITKQGRYQAQSYNGISGLVNLGVPYIESQVSVKVDNAPLGYDLGDGIYKITADSLSAYEINIGSDSAYTVIGSLNFAENKPVALLRGVILYGEKQWPIFTNKKGRFVAEGLATGRYKIIVNNQQGYFEVTEQPQGGRLIRIGNVYLETIDE